MESRERRIHNDKQDYKVGTFKKLMNTISSFFLHALSLAIVAAFLLWVLQKI